MQKSGTFYQSLPYSNENYWQHQGLCIITRNYNVWSCFHNCTKCWIELLKSKFKHALIRHKIYNDTGVGINWIDLNLNQNFNERNDKFMAVDRSRFKVGKNIISNRLKAVNFVSIVTKCDRLGGTVGQISRKCAIYIKCMKYNKNCWN